ncbi:AfsR/SARP family transcriptional regulator [Streptomyces sp. DSM 44915]|uniref:AfsR/SARP family transcriptional regulator n=1 Tax=Streptomyces chisholmiae TaxID=3075540 RepID=A0ABU2JUU0_9ACTN|nr:AfsR/SARP family transcriptional regulator [Streptomyces sp. DSM 44915]MDT0268672.1 AfsR/SARP family transcriptional regulator [Streptomyces sp. DSM 44915]
MSGSGTAVSGPVVEPQVPVSVGRGRERLRFLLLGPLSVVREGRPCTPSAVKRRALLALLLFSANRQVAAGELVEELWDSRPPKSALATLQMYISGLRRTLDPAHSAARRAPRSHPRLTTDGATYRLRVRPGELDLERFRLLAATGRRLVGEGQCGPANRAFHEALALYQGRPLADLAAAGLLTARVTRLAEERLAVEQDFYDTVLCLGLGPRIIGELTERSARHPLREASHEQLMLALCQAGRRAEALAGYASARRVIVREIGVEPGPALREAQAVALSDRAVALARHPRCRPAAG